MRRRPGPCLKPCLAGPGVQVGLLDIDICGPSVPKMLGLEGEEIHQSGAGWSPVYVQVGGADVPCLSDAHVAWSVHAMRAWSFAGSCELVARGKLRDLCPLPTQQENLGVMSIGFMLPNPDDAVIWRGPRKNGGRLSPTAGSGRGVGQRPALRAHG